MPEFNDIPAVIGTQVARTVRRAEEFAVETVRNWSEAVTRAVPDLSVPVAENLPTAKAAVASGFAVAQQVVEAQRDFVLRILDSVEERLAAAAPVEPAPAEPSASASTESA